VVLYIPPWLHNWDSPNLNGLKWWKYLCTYFPFLNSLVPARCLPFVSPRSSPSACYNLAILIRPFRPTPFSFPSKRLISFSFSCALPPLSLLDRDATGSEVFFSVCFVVAEVSSSQRRNVGRQYVGTDCCASLSWNCFRYPYLRFRSLRVTMVSLHLHVPSVFMCSLLSL